MTSTRPATRPIAIPGTPLADASSGLDLCVHCGFCLQSCPTYLRLEDENDSPRGRLLLMRAAVEGDIALDDPALHTHLDRCLGCRACETACPSGVPYGRLLEAARATLTNGRPRNPFVSLLLSTMANDAMRTIVMALARLVRRLRISRILARLPGRAGMVGAMLEASVPLGLGRSWTPTGSGARGSVALLTGCVMEGIFAHTNRATERTLVANDFRLVPAAGQGCCGALHAHAGALDRARVLARHNIAAFERSGAEFVAVNAAGCGAMMRDYVHLLGDDPDWNDRARAFSARVRDVTELLSAAGPKQGGPLALHVSYDAPCHLLHAQRVAEPPLAVLRAIPGLEVTPLPDAEQCCGGAGIYNLVEPEISKSVLEPKLEHLRRSGSSVVATGNPGCHMQIGAGMVREDIECRCAHPVDLLDASYSVAPPKP